MLTQNNDFILIKELLSATFQQLATKSDQYWGDQMAKISIKLQLNTISNTGYFVFYLGIFVKKVSAICFVIVHTWLSIKTFLIGRSIP